MANHSLPDSPVNFNDHLTNQIQLSPTQKPSNLGLMNFSTFEDAMKFCGILSKTEMCPKGYKDKPFEIMCAIQYGHEIGLSPFQAVQSIAVINGKPSIYGDGLIGLCLSSPDCEYINETFDENTMTATCIAKRRGMPEIISTFSQKDAEKARLWNKKGHNGQDTPWITYPKRMLQMRARGFALRDAFADRLKGIITAEEARDYPTQEERPLKLVTPIRKEIQVQEPAAKEQTIKQLEFLVERLIEQKPKAKSAIENWRKQLMAKANVDSLDKLTERQALACIKKIESDDSTAKRAWVIQSRAEKMYKGILEAIPHGFYDDFLQEQLQEAVKKHEYAMNQREQELQHAMNNAEQQGVAVNG